MGTSVAILLVVVAAAVVLGRRGDSTPEPETVGTAGAASATPAPTAAAPAPAALHPTAQPDGVVPAPTAAPAAAPSPAGAITVVLSLTRPCWVAANVDGRRTLYQILQPGEHHTLVAERDVTIRFGDAGAVTWTINGRDAGTPGGDGAVRNVNITRENADTAR